MVKTNVIFTSAGVSYKKAGFSFVLATRLKSQKFYLGSTIKRTKWSEYKEDCMLLGETGGGVE